MMDLIVVHDNDGAIHADWLIRCKDCIYWKSEEERNKQTSWIPCIEMKTDKNWFCGSAKKKKG